MIKKYPGSGNKNMSWRFILATLLLSIYTLNGALLQNVPQTIKQPNGKIINCFASGDEFTNWLHDADGYTIIQHPETGYYVYAQKLNNRLVPSEYVVGQVDPKLVGLEKGARISARQMESRRAQENQFLKKMKSTIHSGTRLNKIAGISINKTAAPAIQQINNLVIFVRFMDEAEFSDNISKYDSLFNLSTPETASLYNYYQEVSYNKLSITSTFYPKTSGAVVLSYQDAQPRTYYQPYNVVTNPAGYDTSVASSDKDNVKGETYRRQNLLKNAINFVRSQVPTSLVIDGDNDNLIDGITFIIKGARDNWMDLLWPHRSAIWVYDVKINNKRAYDYQFQLEDYINVGVLCHETFHTLGAPDLYHYSDDGFQPTGPWDVMSSAGKINPHPGMYMKYRYGGWIDNIPEIKAAGTYILNPVTSPTNNCYKIQSRYSASEYFLVEYRQKNTIYEKRLPGEGLLVYRIRFDREGQGNDNSPDEIYIYRPNGTPYYDGEIYDAHFNQQVGRTGITDYSNPKSFLSNGLPGGLNISNIEMSGNTLSFQVDFYFTPRQFIHYDGFNKGAGIGTNQATTFEAAVRFSTTELTGLYGANMTGMLVWINDGGGNDVTVKVWEGGSSAGPGNLIYQQNIEEEVVLSSWTYHSFTKPILLKAGKEYWIGYRINATGGHPAGADNGPMKANKGAWLYQNNEWKLLTNYNLNYNWNIRSIIESENGKAIASVEPQRLQIKTNVEEIGSETFTIRNSGTADLNFQISLNPVTTNQSSSNSASFSPELADMELNRLFTPALPANDNFMKSVAATQIPDSRAEIQQNEDRLYLDDGNDAPDYFMGFKDGDPFRWRNQFDLVHFNFLLEKIQFYYRTETTAADSILVTITDQFGKIKYKKHRACPLSPNGHWHEIILENPLQFSAGQSINIILEGLTGVDFPAGLDMNAKVTNKSYYWIKDDKSWFKLSSNTSYANAAFLIRAIGKKSEAWLQTRLSIAPIDGTIPPGGSKNITATFDAHGVPGATYTGQLHIINNSGDFKLPIEVMVNPTAVAEKNGILPDKITLHQNYPNPFNPQTNITYSLPESQRVLLKVYDILGHEIVRLVDEVKPAGIHQVRFQAENLPSGVYFCLLEAGSFKQTQKLLLLK